MGFIKKIWKDRISEFPTRRSLTKTDGTSELVTVARSEGMISEEGDAFSAENMNDFENRVANGFNELTENLGTATLLMSTTIDMTVAVENLSDYRYIYLTALHPSNGNVIVIAKQIPLSLFTVGKQIIGSQNYDGTIRHVYIRRSDNIRIAISDLTNVGLAEVYGIR